MKSKNMVIAGLVVVILAATYVWFFVYNKSHTDYQKADAAFSGTAAAFYSETNAANFSETYLNQAVVVSGMVSSVESASMLVLETGVYCQADSTVSFEGLNPNENVTVKGRVAGTEEDILTGSILIRLDNCVLQKD